MNNAVLVLGAGLRLTVTIARSPHRQNIPVIVVPIMAGEPAIKSRVIQRHVRLPDSRAKPDDFITKLTALIQAEGIDMIMPAGRDGAMAAMAQYYEAPPQIAHADTLPRYHGMGYRFLCE